MDTPLVVRLMSPARNALLLLGSSQDSVPGTKVSYSFLAYSSAITVCFELIATRLFSSTSFAPCAQISQWHQMLASPVACPSAIPAGVPLAFSAWHSFRKPSVSFGMPSNPAALTWLLRETIELAPAHL